MTIAPRLPRRLASGWIGLAQALAAAPRPRRPAFAPTEPVIFRSECFAEDLLEWTAPAARAAGARARNK